LREDGSAFPGGEKVGVERARSMSKRKGLGVAPHEIPPTKPWVWGIIQKKERAAISLMVEKTGEVRGKFTSCLGVPPDVADVWEKNTHGGRET